MINKRYVKKAYVLEAICDKCGAEMESTGMVYSSYPEQYPYRCTNPECDGCMTFWAHERPGRILYEFEDEVEACTKS